jgi:hypothetical protein
VDGRNIVWRTKMVSRFNSVDHNTMTMMMMMTTIAVAMVVQISLRFA